MLNKTAIKRLSAKEKAYRVIDYDGLYLEVRPSGEKYWRYRYKQVDGKSTMKSLGRYPDISIALAREARDKKKIEGNYSLASFEDAAHQWYARQIYKSEKNKKQNWSMIETYLLPTLGDKKMSEIKAADIVPILKSIEQQGHLEQCKRVRTKCSQIFRYGVANVMCEYDPTYLLVDATAKPKPKKRAAVINETEFSKLLQKIDSVEKTMPSAKIALQLSPYVVLRSNEIRQAKKDTLNFEKKQWALPAEIMKKERDHIVPLSDTMIELFKRALSFSNSDYIFSGIKKDKPISENTFNKILRRAGYDGDTHVHHGFRSSFSTLGREVHNFSDNLIERQLAHVDKNSVRAAYDRSFRLKERTIMMQQWSDYLDQLKKN